MSNKYLRRVELVVTSNTAGIDLSNMHFTFQTTMFTFDNGNICNLRVYNLDEQTIGRVMGEFTDLILNAGYEADGPHPPTIFEGTIIQVRRGWDGDRAEPYIDITAMDGNKEIAYGVIFSSIDNGADYKQRWQAIAKALKLPLDEQNFPTEDQLPQDVLGQQPRGQTLFMAASDAARDQALHMMCTWSIQRGKIVVIPYNGYATGDIIDINGYTGMIGWPEQTDEGIHVQCLLDGRLQVNSRIRLNNKDTLQQQLNLSLKEYAAQDLQGVGDTGRRIIAADGIYKIVELTHSGDSRGNDWYSDLLCLSLADIPPNQQFTAGNF